MTLFKGAGTALVTPFLDGKVDFSSMGELIDWQVAQGIDAIVSCGTTGEASTLNDKEHIKTVEYTIKRVKGKVPVIAGAGSNDTKHAIEMGKALADKGADGLLIVTPYYNKCTQNGLIKHYTAIAEQVEIPIILYSVQGRTGVNISPSVVKELCEHPKIVGIKEASGSISQVVEIAKYASDDFALYSGNDDMIVPLLSVGGSGVISTVGNVAPKDTHQMVMKYLEGDIKGAAELQLSMKSLIDAMFCEVNPIPVKAALHMMGKIALEYRMPLAEPEPKHMELIKNELKSYRLL